MGRIIEIKRTYILKRSRIVIQKQDFLNTVYLLKAE